MGFYSQLQNMANAQAQQNNFCQMCGSFNCHHIHPNISGLLPTTAAGGILVNTGTHIIETFPGSPLNKFSKKKLLLLLRK